MNESLGKKYSARLLGFGLPYRHQVSVRVHNHRIGFHGEIEGHNCLWTGYSHRPSCLGCTVGEFHNRVEGVKAGRLLLANRKLSLSGPVTPLSFHNEVPGLEYPLVEPRFKVLSARFSHSLAKIIGLDVLMSKSSEIKIDAFEK